MHETVQIDGIFVALAVLLFVGFAIAILVIIDHKAKIPAGLKVDAFSIIGTRRNHPIWAWLVSAFLWLVIIMLVASSAYRITERSFKQVKQEKTLFESLDEEHLAEKVRHFHNSPEKTPYADGVQPICYACHGEFPHSAKPMVRTLLNMHTQFVGCMTCHADGKKVPEHELKLKWLNYSGVKAIGKPFGVDVDPETGALLETDDYYSKIVPYHVKPGGEEVLLEITEKSEEAQEFLKVRGELSAQQQGAVKKMFHSIVNPVGRFCTRCHAAEEESYVPFRELGFSEQRITALTNLNIVGIVQKYREFYIPTIFNSGSSVQERNTLVGKEREVPATEEMKKDPRAWWRRAYDSP